MIQQSHSQAYIQRKPQFKKIHALQCSQQHYLQLTRYGSHLSVHQQMKKERICGRVCVCIYTYIKMPRFHFFMVNMFFIERRHRRHKNAPKQKLHAESQTHLSLVPFSPVTPQVLNVWLLCFSETTTALGHHFLPYFHVP